MAGRPREFDRDEALAKARDIFWRQGYEGTAMSDLVAATGVASASLYAAFGSKEALFREAIALYEREEGGFADRAFAEEDTPRAAIERTFREAVELYTRPSHPRGCFVVVSAATTSADNERIASFLSAHRRARTQSFVTILEPRPDAQALGDYFGMALHGIAVQARDGISKKRLLATIPVIMSVLR